MVTDAAFAAMSETKGPAEAFYCFMATNALSLIMGEQPVRGHDAIRDSLSGMTGSLRWHPVEADASAGGDFGYTWGTYEYRNPEAANGPSVGYGKYVTVWKKQIDGTWKALLDCGNQNPPPR
jgi:ketosteroid isomerase-like protein